MTAPTQATTPGYDSVVRRIAADEHVSDELAEVYFGELLKFLAVAAASERPVSPSKPLDAAWHAFILHTRDYAAYCEQHFARFLHHQPTLGNEDSDGYARARALAERMFGPLDERAWPRLGDGASCQDEGNCKSDCTSDCSSTDN